MPVSELVNKNFGKRCLKNNFKKMPTILNLKKILFNVYKKEKVVEGKKYFR